MRYVVRCQKCTGPEVVCDELRDDQRCQKCGSVPATYHTDDADYCWLHRVQMTSLYAVHPFFLTTVYAWRRQSGRFPNAKLFDGGTEQDAFAMSSYCGVCQLLFEEWLASWRRDQRHAEPPAAVADGGI